MRAKTTRAATRLFVFLTFLFSLAAASAQCPGDINSMVLDDDLDGYSNGDETQNGTDLCSSVSVPADFDADFLSDLLDADDDNDGLSDIVDKFAQDKDNGAATLIPAYYTFQNPDNDGIGNSGFTGLMNNGIDNYANLYAAGSVVIGDVNGKFTVNNIPAGDASGALNNQKNGFQFGVNSGAFPFDYVVSSRVMTPFSGSSLTDFRSMGLFIGTGDQDNYLKISCAANGGAGGIEVVKEVAGAAVSNMYSASIAGSSHINLFFTVNRAANTVQPSYSINGGAAVNAGPAIAVPASWLSNVLAVGVISTSRGTTPFSVSWDNIAVQPIAGNGQWQTINTNNTCVPRHDCGFVMVGSRPFLLGGHGVTTHYTENYTFTSKLWGTSGDVRDATPPEMIHHAQAVQIRGMIYMACGFTGSFPNDLPLSRVYIYDPAYNYWHSGREIPEDRRRGASASVVYNEKIYIIGGLTNGHTSGWTNYLDVFDPYTNTWTVLPDAPHERDHFQAVVHDGKIYCIGGRKTGFGGSTFAETVVPTDVYDIENQTWSTLPSPECDIPTPRAGASVALIGDEIFVIGGENDLQTAALSATEAFNVKTKTWRTVASLNTGRQGTQAIVNNYAIYIVGGTSNRGESPDLNSMEVFYPYGQTTPTGTAYVRGTLQQLPSANVNFGQVAIGNTATKTITIKNSGGTQAMLIKSIHLAQNSLTYYSVSYPYPTPFALNPGDSIKIQVAFRPNSTGVINGTLYVSNTGISGDNTSFGLTGTGIIQQPALRINCAGQQFTTASSDVFAEDFFNQPGTSKISTAQPISGTVDDVLYQTARAGSAFSYNIPVQNNTYTVNLYFAEIADYADAGTNVFDVNIESSTKISALDLFTTAGLNTAYTRTFTITVTDQMMNLDFIGSAGNASVSAIELIPAAVTQGVLTAVPMPLNFPETDINSNSAPITVTLTNTGTTSLTINSVSITGANASNFIHTYGVAATNLIPGATKTFTVTFNPSDAGTRTATMNVSNTGMNATLSIPLMGTGSSTVEPCGYFVEQNGLLVMEVESEKPSGYWTPGTGIPNYTGDDYYTWMGPNFFFEKGNGLLRYEFKIEHPGKYRFKLRSRHPGPDPAHFNDIWVRFPDHGATFEKNGQVMQESGTGWWILSMANADVWTYNSWGLRSTFWEIYVEFKDPGIYYVDLSGRVENFSIDRMVLYKPDQYTEWQACGSNPPQSPWEDCPATPYTWYRDKDLDDYGNPNDTVLAVTKPGAGWIWNNEDCDDNQPTIYPGAPEILDGRDNDCDGIVDEGALLNALSINCGGSAYTALNGDVFESDRLYSPPSSSVKFYNNSGDILNTDDDQLYKSERANSQYTTTFSYNLKVTPNKYYKVTLYFAELQVTNPGARVFNVTLEDSMTLNNFDILATAGYKTAYSYTAYVYVRDTVLNIKFIDVVGKAKINAIKASLQPNVPPTFTLSGQTAFNEDFAGIKLVNVTPDPVLPHETGQTVTYSLSPPSVPFANISINPTTGQITITSVLNGRGNQAITVIANDGQSENNIATKTFTLKVFGVNDAPAFTLSGDVTANKNFSGTRSVTVTPGPVPADEVGQVVTYSLSPASVAFANVSINSSTGEVSITSVANMTGTQLFTVTANDGQVSNNTYSKTFTLTVLEGGCVCDDNNPCTIDTCIDAECVFTPKDCNDRYPCTLDECNNGICTHSLIVCNDNSACTRDFCLNGTCLYNPVSCIDNNACTVDGCNPATGCVYAPIPGCCTQSFQCNDNNACTEDICIGTCTNPLISCDDNSICTTDECNTASGCVFTSVPNCCVQAADCNDADACTADECNNETCSHTAVACDDHIACTDDGCNPSGGCTFTPVPNCCAQAADCDDANSCTVDACNSGTCSSSPLVCNDNSACTTDLCVGGNCNFTPITCNDNNSCTTDGCNPASGCTFTPTANCCTQASDCNDANSCTTDACNSGTCSNAPLVCNDNNSCTADLCVDGNCTFTAITCNDNNSCTSDGCNPASGCTFTPVANCCTQASQCNDNNACTTDACNSGTCSNAPLVCNDNNSCTADLCVDGNCIFTAITCNDNNSCTSDGCNPASGCTFTPVANCCTQASQCNDNNACTTDACNSGSCSNTPIQGCGCALTIESFTLVNSLTDVDIRLLNNTDTINLFVTANVNVRANPCNAQLGSVKFILNGSTFKIESTAPYALAGDASGNYNKWNVSPGTYTLTAIPYSGANATGNAGTSKTITLVVINQQAGCSGNAQCNDNNACTTDVCSNGQCVSSPVNINDNDVCTTDACDAQTGQVTHIAIDCNDNNSCTADGCDAQSGCAHTALPNCCNVNADCNDGNSCTDDACVQGVCTYTQSGNEPSYLKVVNPSKSWRKLKLGYNSANLWSPTQNVIAGGNNQLCLTLRDPLGTAEWSKIQIRPQASAVSSVALGNYVPANPGTGWFTICIPLSAFNGFNFSSISYFEFPYSNGAAAFEIHIQKMEFSGGSTPFLWFGEGHTNNYHDGQSGGGSALIATLIPGSPCGNAKLSDDELANQQTEENGLRLESYPNPFSDKLNIEFTLAEDSHVKLEVFNLTGQRVGALFEGDVKGSELQKFEFVPEKAGEGMYIYRLQTESGSYYGKAVMAR